MEKKTEMYFARETRNIENKFARIDREFLAFVADKLRLADDLSTAEKYTLLTAFVEDITESVRVVSGPIFAASSADKTAAKLANVYHQYEREFGLKEKRNALQERMYALLHERNVWDKENSPENPLLPNRW